VRAVEPALAAPVVLVAGEGCAMSGELHNCKGPPLVG
jgi:hypothetical protein